MKLPRFFDRAADATTRVIGEADRESIRARLVDSTVRLTAAAAVADDPQAKVGFIFAANLAARFYPRIQLNGPKPICDEAATAILAINPAADVGGATGDAQAELCWSERASSSQSVCVMADAWNLCVDEPDVKPVAPATASAALAAAAVGIGELFRIIFSDVLGRSARTGPTPFRLNLITLESRLEHWPEPAARLDLGDFYLAGAGAIGQAAVATLRHLPATGTLYAVDPEVIELSNLQRYVLTSDADEGERKTKLIARALEGTDIGVREIPTTWGKDERTKPYRAVVLTALDSPEARIAVQSGLHRAIYNAWTQPLDLGWSRHEAFGVDPCLACLYWPTKSRPSLYQNIARALRQHELRVLAYLATNVPIGSPLAPAQIRPIPGTPLPPDASRWSSASLADDLAAALGLTPAHVARWRSRGITTLYREGVCGGALIPAGSDGGEDAIVPVAHQSALAGVMLATQFYAAMDPELRARRPATIEGRFNIFGGFPQELRLPRQRTVGCLCADVDYQSFYNAKWMK